MQWRVGRAGIGRVEELRIDLPIARMTGDAAFVARYLASLPRGFLDPDAMTFQFCCQCWIIRVDGLTMVVDPCNGNGRKRPGFAWFEDLETDWLARFAATGVRPEDVDFVFCTHLHCDHCGWNTKCEDGRWVPTFPNATYLLAAAEVARWQPGGSGVADDPHAAFNEYNDAVFDESVRPILDAGLARVIEPPYRVSPSLAIEAAPGHTLGHSMLRLASDGEHAYFAGDTLHHPAQVLRPELHLPGCDDLDQAIATRRALFERARAEGALIFPAHFPEPHHGRVVDSELGFGFVPGGAADW